jgi:hypothetical protein
VKKFYTKSTGSKVIFMDGGNVVEDNVEIRSLSYTNTDMVALWTVSIEKESLGVAFSSRHNAQSVKEESHAKTSWETRSAETSQDLPSMVRF